RQMGEYESAVSHLRQATIQDPGDAEAHYYLGSVLVKLNSLDHAILSLSKAVELNPYDSGSRVSLAAALKRAGRATEADEQTKQAQALDEIKAKAGRSRVLLGSGLELLDKGHLDQALDELRQSVALSPEYAEAQFQFARALRKKGAPAAEVASVLRRVIELKPDYAQAHFELGVVLQRDGKIGEGLREIERAVELAPSLAAAHRALGKAAVESHDWNSAISEFGAILIWYKDD